MWLARLPSLPSLLHLHNPQRKKKLHQHTLPPAEANAFLRPGFPGLAEEVASLFDKTLASVSNRPRHGSLLQRQTCGREFIFTCLRALRMAMATRKNDLAATIKNAPTFVFP